MCKEIPVAAFIYDQLVGKQKISILELHKALHKMQDEDPTLIIDINRDTILDFVNHEPGVKFEDNCIIKRSDYFKY